MKVGELLDVVRDGTAVQIYAYAWSSACDAGNDMDFTGETQKGAIKDIDPAVMTVLRNLPIESITADPAFNKHSIEIFVRLNYNDFEKLGSSIAGDVAADL